MQIQINTDHNIHGYESAAASVRATVENALRRFSTQITRVDVHLGDENAGKRGGDDKRCMMEARLEGHQPVAVTHHAATVVQAIDGAAEKMAHRLERMLGRLHSHRGNGAMPVFAEPDVPGLPDNERPA
ncbi:MAG TPA: HPF/RaiA family ribosome-associated protein [Steroidobacteraceae bacterium]|nr:HPF/RaiA family ribosome-associated protein [Steroidobacteraceae bacterium]